MGFKNKCYVTVWNDKETGKVVQVFDKYATATVSTSKKNPNAKNGYETDFNGRVRFIGRAFEKIRTLALPRKTPHESDRRAPKIKFSFHSRALSVICPVPFRRFRALVQTERGFRSALSMVTTNAAEQTFFKNRRF